MLKQIEDFCQQYNMLSPGMTVLACVSGGTDSMCLLHALLALAPGHGLRICAAHYNHRLRGAESDGDEEFVREYCRKLNVPFFSGSGDVAAEAARRGAGIEETARDMRYDFFLRTAADMDRVATAHNADDNLETVLMRMVRGTGLKGLGGIPPARGKLIRPLLGLTRAQIEAYNRENGVPHREDSTNASDDYTRNRIRHTVVPALRELRPSLNITAMTGLLRQDEEYLSDMARAFLARHAGGLDVQELLALPFPIASRAIRIFCGSELGLEHVSSVLSLARGGPSARLDLPGLKLRREYGRIVKDAPGVSTFRPTALTLDSPVIIDGTDFTVFCKEGPYRGGIYNSLTTFHLKRDKIAGELLVRPRVSGDAITLPGGTASLKKLMIDRKIPRSRRDAVPVIADGHGPLAVWSVGQDVKYMPALGEPAIEIKIEERKI